MSLHKSVTSSPNTPSAFSPWLTTHCPAPLRSFHHSWHHPRPAPDHPSTALLLHHPCYRGCACPLLASYPDHPDPGSKISRKRHRKHTQKKWGCCWTATHIFHPFVCWRSFPRENLEGKPLKPTILHHTQPTFCEFIDMEKYIPHSQLGIFMV